MLESERVTAPAPTSPYWAFYDEVARQQLLAWQPSARGRVLDLSERSAGVLDDAHDVVHPERDLLVDLRSLDWLADDCLDGAVAGSTAVSIALEETARDLARVLRPGGRLMLCVDSLASGLAQLADQGRWAELADVRDSDCVLVPTASGGVVRCFSPDELRDLLRSAGFVVEWVRPRSVLTPSHVERVLDQDARAMAELVRAELDLCREHEDESAGLHLVASARLP